MGFFPLKEELLIPSGIYEQMVGHAAGDAQNEVCGILAGYPTGSRPVGAGIDLVERIFQGKNADRSAVSYDLDPRQQLQIEKELRKEGMKMLAIYHSHPVGQAYPSPKDVLLAVWDVIYIIIGFCPGDKNHVRAFRVCGDKTKTVQEVLFRIV